MRDDRYRGTRLSRPVRKLCRMAEREADRGQPERLRRQAVAALISDARREISPEFLRRLQQQNSAPHLFGASEIAASAWSGLEADIGRALSAGQGVDVTDALCEALRRRGDGYAREQTCQLIADRHAAASLAPASVRTACNDGALVAAVLILSGDPAPRVDHRVGLNENLVAPHESGAP